jgi:SAM-dependent methyltransferase
MMPFIHRMSTVLRYGFGGRSKGQSKKERARQAVFASNLWHREAGLAQRRYASYDVYVAHQASKLAKVMPTLQKTEAEDFADFIERFRNCTALSGSRSVLCLGARLGTEVKALHALGYFAVGIDLNPGPDNSYVLPGDFHAMVFPDESVDAIYTNALDHVFDLEKVIGEICRLLRPNGLFLADVVEGFEEGFTPGAFEAIHWQTAESFVKLLCDMSGLKLEAMYDLRDLGRKRRDRWIQALIRKPASLVVSGTQHQTHLAR